MSSWPSRTSRCRATGVDTIADFAAVEQFGVLSAGGADAATAAVVAELADLVGTRAKLEVPNRWSLRPSKMFRDAFPTGRTAAHPAAKVVLRLGTNK